MPRRSSCRHQRPIRRSSPRVEAAPSLSQAQRPEEGNRYGLPAFYSLHDWAWKTNPDGEFAMYNPDVTCPAALTAPAPPTS